MCWRADVPAGKEGWCWLAFAPSSFISLVTVVVGRKNASTSFLIPHAGPRMHKRLQWFVVQLTFSGTRGLLWLQRGIELVGRAEGPGRMRPGLVLLVSQWLPGPWAAPRSIPQQLPRGVLGMVGLGWGAGCSQELLWVLRKGEQAPACQKLLHWEEQKTALHVPSLECLEPASHCSHRSFHV